MQTTHIDLKTCRNEDKAAEAHQYHLTPTIDSKYSVCEEHYHERHGHHLTRMEYRRASCLQLVVAAVRIRSISDAYHSRLHLRNR